MKFKPESIAGYKLRDRLFMETKVPLKYKIKRYELVDGTLKTYIAIVKRRGWLLEIISLCVLLVVLYLSKRISSVSQLIQIPDEIVCSNYTELNINNLSSNDPISIEVIYKDKSLFGIIKLDPGQGISNIEALPDLNPGIYVCVVKYTIYTKDLSRIIDFPVTVNIKESV